MFLHLYISDILRCIHLYLSSIYISWILLYYFDMLWHLYILDILRCLYILFVLYLYLMDITILFEHALALVYLGYTSVFTSLVYSVLISHGYILLYYFVHLYILDILRCFRLNLLCTYISWILLYYFMHLYVLDILRYVHLNLLCTYIS